MRKLFVTFVREILTGVREKRLLRVEEVVIAIVDYFFLIL